MKLAALTLATLLFSGVAAGLERTPVERGDNSVERSACSTRSNARCENSLDVYVQYHVWYDKGDCTAQQQQKRKWWHWMWNRDVDACEPREGAPWARQINSTSYPLIGPYDSKDPDVLRWHIQLAKSAGIDGFFVSLYTWNASEKGRFLDAFETMLDVAHQEDFKLGIEAWHPWDGNVAGWKSEVLGLYDAYTEHPAFLRINDKPAMWFNIYGGWMAGEELESFLEQRDALWILGAGPSPTALQELNQRLVRSSAQKYTDYHWPSSNGEIRSNNYSQELEQLKKKGLVTILHGYPCFDEQTIADSSERDFRYLPCRGGQTIRNLVAAANGADILIESFNDYIEGTMLEPGFDLDAAIEVHDALAELVVAERFER